MESHEEANGGAGGGTGGANKSSFLCRQSSSRWIPTTDQIRILRDLYYNCGVRSPSAEQIQRISARLRQFGKIEGKNVFYWFQNHKARERQKKRLTVDVTSGHNKFSNHGAVISSGFPLSLSRTCDSRCILLHLTLFHIFSKTFSMVEFQYSPQLAPPRASTSATDAADPPRLRGPTW